MKFFSLSPRKHWAAALLAAATSFGLSGTPAGVGAVEEIKSRLFDAVKN